jgi:hypothetical protein
LPRLKQIGQSLQVLQLEPKSPKRVIRRRGYTDHGTLRESSRWLPTSGPEFDEEQRNIDQERQSDEDTLNLIKGFLGIDDGDLPV